jgi:thiosulfate dehydrogenase [quinone] large subunit
MQVLFERPPKVLSRRIIVMLRIYLGVVLLVSGINKVLADPPWTPERQIAGAIQGRAHGFYKPFLEKVVQPNVETFGRVIRWGELLLGLALISGALTRLAAVLTILMMVNYGLMKGTVPGQSTNDWAFAVIALAVLLGAGGRTLGVDYYLARRHPRGILW